MQRAGGDAKLLYTRGRVIFFNAGVRLMSHLEVPRSPKRRLLPVPRRAVLPPAPPLLTVWCAHCQRNTRAVEVLRDVAARELIIRVRCHESEETIRRGDPFYYPLAAHDPLVAFDYLQEHAP